jgi:hypothetical protein
MGCSLSRRRFLRTAAAVAATASAGPAFARGAETPKGEEEKSDRPLYAFVLLGDLHYDRRSHHDMDWVRREKPNDVRQIDEYVEITEKYTPRLMQRVNQVVRSVGAPVPFVVQAGDFTEGLCGSSALQERQFNDAIGLVKESLPGVPFLVTKGNHDITGPGAEEAYDRVMLPWLGEQIGRDLKSASFAVTHGEDLFVFFDGYDKDLDWLEKTLEGGGVRRHLFFVIHPPVVPYNARSSWHVFSRPDDRVSRRRLLELLGRHKAIVLSAHLHRYGLVTRATRLGAFVQLGANSVITSEETVPRQVLEGVDKYGPDLVDLEPDFSPDTLELRRELLKEEKPSIRHFEFANVAGYTLFKVHPDRVVMEFSAGFGPDVWKRRDLARIRAIEA